MIILRRGDETSRLEKQQSISGIEAMWHRNRIPLNKIDEPEGKVGHQVMNKQIVKIQDPLLIVSIVVALTEIAGMIVLTTLARDIQPPFEWFLIVLPFGWILFISMMLVLAPSRIYRWATPPNEGSISQVLATKKLISDEFAGLLKQIAIAKQELLTNSPPHPSSPEETELPALGAIVHEQMESIRERAESTRESTTDVAIACSLGQYPVCCHSCALVQLLSPDLLCWRCKKPLEARK